MSALSLRLNQAKIRLKGFHTLIDIGTDHALLPIEAIRMGYIQRAIAVDNKQKPLDNAKKNIVKARLEGAIDVCLSDGFDQVEATFDVVTILGMGGHLINDILMRAKFSQPVRLILAPNKDADVVRMWLEANHYQIIDESFIVDKRVFYQLIVAETGEMRLNPIEREFGPMVLKRPNGTFNDFIHTLIRQQEHALKNVKQSDERENISARIRVLKGVIQ